VIEDRGRDEITAIVSGRRSDARRPAALPFFLADVNVMQIGLSVAIRQRRDPCLRPAPDRTSAEFGSALYKEPHKFVRYRFFNDDTTCCGAALARRRKGAEDRGLDREWEIGVGENHQWIFSAISHWHFFMRRAPCA